MMTVKHQLLEFLFCFIQAPVTKPTLALYGADTNLSSIPLLCSFLLLPDVCNSTDLPEVEIISLLEEQLPHYKLRADTIYGYEHDDWLHTPLLSPDANVDLTVEQIEETLKYFRKWSSFISPPTRMRGRWIPHYLLY